MVELEQSSSKKKRLKFGLISVAVFLIFGFGYSVGSGNFDLGFASSGRSSTSNNLNFSKVEEVYDLLRKNFDGKLDEGKLVDGMRQGLVSAAGDPHTEFLTAEQTKEFNESLSGTFSGIGAELGKDNDAIIIVAPLSGYPAEKAGLKSRDIIMEVNGESTYGFGVSETAKKIRGPEGTEVKLKILRDKKQELEFTIKRESISIPSVESKTLDNNIGYIKISQFSDDTVKLARDYAEKLQQANVKGIILDVRGNPGGLLDSAVGVSSLWLTSDKVVLQEKRDGVVIKTYNANGDPILKGLPTVVLIDGGSASASEIVAGALRDNNVAILFGETSYGKGSVQVVKDLPDGSSLKVTIARWFTPNGRNIDKEGIKPDTEVKQSEDANEDVQLQSAIDKLK